MKVFLVALVIIFSLSSCFSFKQEIGKGIEPNNGKDTMKAVAKVITVSKKRWYLMWGLSPLNTVDAKKMAKGAANYTIKQSFSLTDIIISLPTALFLSSQTVTVKRLAGNSSKYSTNENAFPKEKSIPKEKIVPKERIAQPIKM